MEKGKHRLSEEALRGQPPVGPRQHLIEDKRKSRKTTVEQLEKQAQSDPRRSREEEE
jgi:hypothetical protein